MISLRLSIHYIAEARQAVGSILFLPDLADMSTAKSLIQSYTFIPNESGGAVDDAYLYRSAQDEYLLVANDAKPTVWRHTIHCAWNLACRFMAMNSGKIRREAKYHCLLAHWPSSV